MRTIGFLILTLVNPVIFAAQQGLPRARDMLHALRTQQHEAAKGATSSKLTTADIVERLIAVQTVVNGGIASELNSPTPSACEMLQEKLRRSLGYRGESDPNVANVLCVGRNNETYSIIAYDLTVGPTYSRSWIGVFGRAARGSSYQILATADNTLPNKTVALSILPPQRGGALAFLAYGVNWGDAHNRLSVIAYYFNKHEIKEKWSRTELPEGAVRVKGNRIQLSFLNMAVGPGFSGVHEVKQVYIVTPTGVRLESTFTGPNSVGIKPPPGAKQ